MEYYFECGWKQRTKEVEHIYIIGCFLIRKIFHTKIESVTRKEKTVALDLFLMIYLFYCQ